MIPKKSAEGVALVPVSVPSVFLSTLRPAFEAGLDVAAAILQRDGRDPRGKIEEQLDAFAKACDVKRPQLQAVYDAAGNTQISGTISRTITQVVKTPEQKMCAVAYSAGVNVFVHKAILEISKIPDGGKMPDHAALHKRSALQCFDRLNTNTEDVESFLRSLTQLCGVEDSQMY